MSLSSDKNDLKTISIDQLRRFEGLGNLSDDEAQLIISSLKELALITHEIISLTNEQPATISNLRQTQQAKNNSKQ